MNRLSPLIVRRVGPMATASSVAAGHRQEQREEQEQAAGTLLEDAKLFLTGWLGGLIFFGTFLG